MFWRALAWLAFLGPFFFLSYGWANWITSLREPVPSFVFAWERHIPFLPWTIVPYWSVDLLYALSFFLCRTREELNLHGRRLLAVQLLSIAGFLLFPLKLAHPRPETTGLAGDLFTLLGSFDGPYNEAPSLHIAILVILWHRFPWAPVRAWMILAALSTLTTWQHHFIDLPTGLLAGVICQTVLPWPRLRTPSLRLTLTYGAGGAALLLAPWPFWWPAVSLLCVSGIYAIGEPALFRKGSWTAAWILGPYRWTARASAWWITRRESPANLIADGLWLGRARAAGNWPDAMLDCTAEIPVFPGRQPYINVPMLDLVVARPHQWDRAVAAIDELPRPLLVFCALGRSRSAATVAAWLLHSGRAATVSEAVSLLRARRPQIYLRPSHLQALESWAATRVRAV